MPRFAILIHDYPQLHWDLLLEQPPLEMLRTWRLERPPEDSLPIAADALPKHRPVYLDYEGPISGNRGEVRRWDAGEFSILFESDTRLEIEIQGRRITGKATLTLQEGDHWIFQFQPEERLDAVLG